MHYRSQSVDGTATCAAFPVRIPAVVMRGRNRHRRPINGDHGIQWKLDPAFGSATPEEIAEWDAALARGEIPGLTITPL